MFLKTEQFEYNGVSVTLSELSALQRFDYIKFVSDAEQQETTKHDVVHINQRYLENGIPACGDVAMAFPFPQRHSGLSGDRDAADPP